MITISMAQKLSDKDIIPGDSCNIANRHNLDRHNCIIKPLVRKGLYLGGQLNNHTYTMIHWKICLEAMHNIDGLFCSFHLILNQ